ncbi:helix-turn-helix domain-containing protein [Eionea flava]
MNDRALKETSAELVNLDNLTEYVPGECDFSVRSKSDSMMVNQWYFPQVLEDAPPLLARNHHGFGLLISGSIKGSFQHNYGKWKKAELGNNQWIMSPAKGNAMNWRWKADSPEDVPLSVVDFHLSPKVMADVASQALDIDGDSVIELPHKLNIPDKQLGELALYILSESKKNNPYGQLFIDTAAQLFAVHLLNNHCSTPNKILKNEYTNKLSSDRCKKVTEYIEEHITEDLSLIELANAANLSVYHFSREFKQTTGCSPHQYVTQRRVEKAKHLLATTSLPIDHIAWQVGIKRLSHFSTLFKRSVGVTPTTYRKNT